MATRGYSPHFQGSRLVLTGATRCPCELPKAEGKWSHTCSCGLGRVSRLSSESYQVTEVPGDSVLGFLHLQFPAISPISSPRPSNSPFISQSPYWIHSCLRHRAWSVSLIQVLTLCSPHSNWHCVWKRNHIMTFYSFAQNSLTTAPYELGLESRFRRRLGFLLICLLPPLCWCLFHIDPLPVPPRCPALLTWEALHLLLLLPGTLPQVSAGLVPVHHTAAELSSHHTSLLASSITLHHNPEFHCLCRSSHLLRLSCSFMPCLAYYLSPSWNASPRQAGALMCCGMSSS